MVKYERVLLKITGEAMRSDGRLFDKDPIDFVTDEIRSAAHETQLAVVIGGGNIVRGSDLIKRFRTKKLAADNIGMLSTVMNAILLQDQLEQKGVETRVMSSIEVNKVAEPYIPRRAIRHLEKGRVVILAAGTGNSGVTTDTAALLRASDLETEIVLKGTKVDGVYDKDPIAHKDAEFFAQISYQQFLEKGIDKILDVTAVAQAKQDKMPIIVFNIFEKGNLLRVLQGEPVGSKIS